MGERITHCHSRVLFLIKCADYKKWRKKPPILKPTGEYRNDAEEPDQTRKMEQDRQQTEFIRMVSIVAKY